MDKQLTKQEKINLIVGCLKQNSRASIKEISEKTNLSKDTINNYICYVKGGYVFTIIEKNSNVKELLDIQGWFKEK